MKTKKAKKLLKKAKKTKNPVNVILAWIKILESGWRQKGDDRPWDGRLWINAYFNGPYILTKDNPLILRFVLAKSPLLVTNGCRKYIVEYIDSKSTPDGYPAGFGGGNSGGTVPSHIYFRPLNNLFDEIGVREQKFIETSLSAVEKNLKALSNKDKLEPIIKEVSKESIRQGTKGVYISNKQSFHIISEGEIFQVTIEKDDGYNDMSKL